MAVYIHCNFNSEVLRMATDVNILIPDNDRVRQFREKTNVPVKYRLFVKSWGKLKVTRNE